MRPIPVAITIAVAAIVVQILGPSPSQTAKPQSSPQSLESDRDPAGLDPDDPVFSVMGRAVAKRHTQALTSKDLNSHYTTYLVLAPDPGKTRLGLYFDRWIDSVQLAVEHSGYRFDTHWLPWRSPGAQPATPDKDQTGRLKHPGILLFRRSDGCNPRIAVLVVGENPAHGVDRDHMQWILRSGLDIAGVVGPSFSGSFDSLTEIYAGKHDLRQNLRIISGTATNPDAIARFRTHFPRFETVIRDDGVALAALKAYLSRHTLTTTTLAILTESGTAYGQQFRAQRARNGKLRTLSVQFPREISAIRNAYQEDASLSGGRPQTSPEDIALRLQLRDSHRGDTVPLLGGPASAVTQESLLIHIAATLREERADYVAIAATNVLDVLFLARFVRKICPDVRLVFLENDALFVRPPDSASFIGSLAISTYSLMLRNQLWIRPNTEWLVPFSSSSTEGVYNAMLALIDNTPLADYYPPGESGKAPPVWITMSGRDRYWPVASHATPATEPLRAAPPQFTTIQFPNPGNLWLVMYGSLVLTAIWFAACTRLAARTDRRRVTIASFYLPRANLKTHEGQGRAYYHMLMLFALIGVMMILCGPVFVAAPHSSLTMRLIAVASAIVIAWLGAEAARIYLRLLWPGTPDSRYIPLAVLGFLLIGMTFWFGSLTGPSDHEGLFVALRSLDPASGVSPLIPLLLASLAYVCWCWVHWQRMILFRERSVPLSSEPFSEIQHRARWIRKYLGTTFQLTHRRTFLLLAAIVTVVCLVLDSFENRNLDTLFRMMTGGICGLLGVNFYMFLVTWRRLREILTRLELLPFREAFSTIPEQLGRTALWVNNPYRPSYALLVRAEETLRALARKEPSYLSDLPAQTIKFSSAVNGLIESETRGIRPPAAEQRHPRELSCDLASRFSAKLGDYWRDQAADSQPNTDSTPKDSKADGKESVRLPRDAHASAEHFVALHYVMFIRSVMLGLRNYVNSFVTGFILLTLALNAYPFQSAGRIRWMITAIFITIGGGLVISMVQMDHNPILSRLTRTKPSEFDPQFWYKVATIGILPLLTAVGSQFPELTRLIVSWVQPAISALK